ncbi:type II toxin-antitoxin system PrlF family antitoxin [Spirulina sp. CS-785/01]|uniref:type II toxin-antitoxin system PrlF family antitoxin n=1 Tax=Spirulina sp. CS-785/01 TaxID=3021716 RepID=UPI00232D1F64|nr:type II toxin-antitoxin system PrlF family antitoxin [Spirulina sp. CS-785/01]MDB9315815.1 type II toxin-antitoxin system PrlF family antitoxin [Spirulina sp. CS-785/01]
MKTPKVQSKLTKRYQTTIPEPIRQVLGLKKLDKITYTVQEDGQVVISRFNPEDRESDPILEQFLDFLVQDMQQNPQNIQGISSDLIDHLQSLVADVEIDLDAPLLEEDE